MDRRQRIVYKYAPGIQLRRRLLAFTRTVRRALGGSAKLPPVEYLASNELNPQALREDVRKIRGAKIKIDQSQPGDGFLFSGMPTHHIMITGLTALDELRLRTDHELRLIPRPPLPPKTSKAIKLRWAHQKDLAQLVALERVCFDPKWRAKKTHLLKRIETADVILAIDTRTGKPVGFVIGTVKDVKIGELMRNVTKIEKPQLFGSHYQIVDLGIHPDWRERGVARLLLNKGLELAHQRQSTTAFGFTINKRIAALFENEGFVLGEARHLEETPLSPLRTYMRPLVAGPKKQAIKNAHEQWKDALKALRKARCLPDAHSHLRIIVKGIRQKYPEILQLSPEEQATTMTERLWEELLWPKRNVQTTGRVLAAKKKLARLILPMLRHS